MKNHFALRTSHFALRTSHFALRTSHFALSAAADSPLSLLLLAFFFFSFPLTAQKPEAYWMFNSGAAYDDAMNNWDLDSVMDDDSAFVPSGGLVGGYLDLDSIVLKNTSTLGFQRTNTNTGSFLTHNDSSYVSVEFLLRLSPEFHNAVVVKWVKRFSFQICEEHLNADIALAFNQSASYEVILDGIGKKDFGYYSDGNWHHIVVTYSACTGIVTVYVDGTSPPGFQSQKSSATAPIGTGGTIDFTPSFDQLLGGSIDEVAVYDTLLSPYMVWRHYQNALAGYHYDTLTAVNDPVLNSVVFLPEFTDPGEDLSEYEFGPGYPSVTELPYDLLRASPGVRMLPNTPMPRITSFIGDWQNLYDNDTMGGVKWADSIQRELALHYHYNMSLGGERDHDPVNFGKGNYSIGKVLTDLACNSSFATLERSMIINWARAYHPVYNKKSNLILNTPYLWRQDMHYTDSSYYRMMHCQGDTNYKSTSFFSPAAPQDSLVLDGNDIWKLANNALTYMKGIAGCPAGIEIFSENGEIFNGTGWDATAPDTVNCDSNVQNDINQNFPGLSVPAYINARLHDFAMTYRTGFLNSINAVNDSNGRDTLDFRWYKNSGRTNFPMEYATFRFLNTGDNGVRRHSPSFYPQVPANWRNSPGSITSLTSLGPNIYYAQAEGDSLMNPFVASGWRDNTVLLDNEEALRPGQWLGLLKHLGSLGADTYTNFMYDGVYQPWPGNYRIWQLATPAYAQAVTSRVADLIYQGKSMSDYPVLDPASKLCGGSYIWFAMKSGNLNHYITARKSHSLKRWLITGSVQRLMNAQSIAKIADAGIVLDNTPLQFEIRLQGSSYIYDISGSDTVFYQLDRWHEWKDPWWWCKDFEIEAELHDSISTLSIKTERAPGTQGGDYRGSVAYLEQDTAASASAVYHILCRDTSQQTLWPWIRARINTSCGGNPAHAGLNLNGGTSWPPALAFDDIVDTSWTWYSLIDSSGSQESLSSLQPDTEYSLHLVTDASCMDIDKMLLFRNPGNHFNTGLAANAQADTTWVCLGNTIQFNMNNSQHWASCIEQEWNFGDGSKSYSENPSHVYTYGDTFLVTLTISETCGEDEDTDTLIIIIGAPAFDAGPDLYLCAGDSGQLNANGNTLNCTWGWSNDPLLSNPNILDPMIAVDTLHRFYFHATDNVTGCAMSDSVKAFVIQPDMRDTTYYLCNSSDSVFLAVQGCFGTRPVDSTGLYKPADTIFWKAGNFQQDTNVYSILGWDACLCDIDTVDVTVIIMKNLILTKDTMICPGDTLEIFTMDTLHKWNWLTTNYADFGDPQQYMVFPDQSTAYIVEVTDDIKQKCTDTININIKPSGISADACPGDPASLHAGANAVSILWKPGAAVVNDTALFTFTVNPVTPGSSIIAWMTDTSGCEYKEFVKIKVSPHCCFYPSTDPNWTLNYLTAGHIIDNINGGSPVITGKTITVNGKLWLDRSIRFTNCDIYIGPYGWMEFTDHDGDTLQIDRCTLTACNDTMWNGLFCEFTDPYRDGYFYCFDNGGTSAEISHSMNGVLVKSKGDSDIHQVVRNSFLNNNSSLYYSNAIFKIPMDTMKWDLARENYFETDSSAMKYPFQGDFGDRGMTLSTTTMVIPPPGVFPELNFQDNRFVNIDTGIFVTQASSVLINENEFFDGRVGLVIDHSYVYSDSNKFRGNLIGIIARDSSDLECFKNYFRDILKVTSPKKLKNKGTAIYVTDMTGIANTPGVTQTSLLVRDSSEYGPIILGNAENRFENCTAGILAEENVRVDVLRNRFEDIAANAVFVGNTYGQKINVIGNYISNAWTGIRTSLNLNSMININNNLIVGDTSGTASIQYGIRILNGKIKGYSNPFNATLAPKTFLIDNQIYLRGTGIHTSNQQDMLIRENKVHIYPKSSAFDTVVGIRLQKGDRSVLDSNIVTAEIPYPVDQTRGIYLSQTQHSLVKCNDITYFGDGLFVLANNWDTKLWYNHINKAFWGSHFINDGITGIQGDSINDISSGNVWNDFHKDSTNLVMVVADSTKGYFNLHVVMPPMLTYPEHAAYNHSKNKAINTGPLNVTTYKSVADSIFEDCQDFVSDTSGTGGGSKLFELLVRDSVDFIYWTEEMPHYQAIFTYEWLAENEPLRESNAIYSDLFDSLDLTNIKNIYNVEVALDSGDIIAAREANAFEPENDLETVLQIVYGQLFDVLKYGKVSISENDSLILDSIANLCSIEGGYGVNTARAILVYLDPSRDFDHICVPVRGSSGKRNEANPSPGSPKYDENMIVFPNPAENEFSVRLSDGSGQIQVVFPDGRICKTQNTETEKLEYPFSSHQMVRGVYIVSWKREGMPDLHRKLILL